MEESPLFNAGKGAVLTHEGKNELDAAIMNGKTLAAGSIAGVTVSCTGTGEFFIRPARTPPITCNLPFRLA